MNTLKKIGLTALGTSLVASSAIAADWSIGGDAGYTWSSENIGGNAATDGIGYNHDITISGSGELDNGWSVSTTMIFVEDSTLSSSNVKVTMGSLGTVKVGQGTGSIGASFDSAIPTAWEENHDGMATSTAIDNIGASMDNGVIDYTSPAIDLGGVSATLMLAYNPDGSDTNAGEGGVSKSSVFGKGQAAGITLAFEGLTLGAFGAEVDKDGGSSTRDQDSFEGTWYAKYSAGPVSIGYQTAYIDRGIAGAAAANNSSAKTVAAGNGAFESETMSIAFNVNENLSISWAELTETYDEQDDGTVGDADMDSTSLQFAYTMGSMSIKGYQTDEDNPGWDTDALSNEITEIAVNFAF